MTLHADIGRYAAVCALLWGGMSVPIVGWTHWEGFEAADPSTPAALLRFESAATGYVEADVTLGSWLARFEVDGQRAESGQTPAPETATGERDAVDAEKHSGHTGVEAQTPAPIPE